MVSDKKYSATHTVISLTEDIRKNLDEGNIGCGIFADLQKAFDTVEHDILLAKPSMVSVILQMNGLDPIYPAGNNVSIKDTHREKAPKN